ncbi:hypothetical protein V5799_024605 [Amblyomma americanum]|uniref:Uncharacterized protein n=1 Tax=Amblyomma americanum TaxID=6943 RepID=A0AAQ4EBJ8_AMBAM
MRAPRRSARADDFAPRQAVGSCQTRRKVRLLLPLTTKTLRCPAAAFLGVGRARQDKNRASLSTRFRKIQSEGGSGLRPLDQAKETGSQQNGPACVCSKHFLPEHFDRMSPLVVRIRADAVPLQAPMDVAESQETLAGPSQQAPMDVTESQGTLPGPSQQASMDVATMLDIQPGPSQAFQLTPVSFISSCVVSIQVYSLHEVGCRCNSAM